MKRITYDEVKQNFENRGYILLSTEYINITTKLEYVCQKHQDKGIQKIDYHHFKRGQGCRFCGQENKLHGKEKPLEDYHAKELTESKGMEFVKITRENSILYVYYVCPKHEEHGVQKTTLESMRKKKVGCPYCIGRNKTTENFKKELYKINPNIEVIDEYKNAKSPIQCKCIIDGTKWISNANTLLRGEGCPTCGKLKSIKNRTKTNEQFIDQLKQINPDIIPLEEYQSVKQKILVSCTQCGHQWLSTPDNLLQGTGCPECMKIKLHNRQAKTNEQFLLELKQINPILEPLEPYYNDHTKILVRCKKHNYKWYVAPNKILHRSTGCPKCTAYNNEQKILSFLEELGYNTSTQKRYNECKDKYVLPFDIYVEELNLLIEYDGEGHYYPIRRGSMTYEEAYEQLKITKKHDRIKTQYCVDNDIPLIRIPYWQNYNIELFLVTKMIEYNLIDNSKLLLIR